MRMIILVITLFLSQIINAQIRLPKAETFLGQAITDNDKDITNDKWSKTKCEGFVCFIKIFKSTPIGLKHGLEEYENLKSEYQTRNCIDASTISSLVVNNDNTQDLEMLSITIRSESSEILKYCELSDRSLASIKLHSVNSRNKYFLWLTFKTAMTE